MALDANGVALLQPQATGGLMDFLAVRLVAIDTGHAPLKHAVMVRQGELAVGRDVALEAGERVVARVHDVGGQAGPDMFTTGAVARLAAGNRGPVHAVATVKTAVRTAREIAVDFLVALGTSLVADKCRAGNLRRCGQGERCALSGGAGNKDGTNEGEAEQRREVEQSDDQTLNPAKNQPGDHPHPAFGHLLLEGEGIGGAGAWPSSLSQRERVGERENAQQQSGHAAYY